MFVTMNYCFMKVVTFQDKANKMKSKCECKDLKCCGEYLCMWPGAVRVGGEGAGPGTRGAEVRWRRYVNCASAQ